MRQKWRPAAGWLVVAIAITMLFSRESIAQKKPKQGGGPQHVFSGPAPEHAFDIILARPTTTSITVSVMAARDTQAYLSHGISEKEPSGKTSVVRLPAGAPVEFNLKDLKPDSRHYYRLHHREGTTGEFMPGPAGSFQTGRRPGESFVFTMQADSHLDQGTRPAVYEKTMANVLAHGTDFHVDLGDTFMTDKYPNYRDALPQYIAQRYYLGLVGRAAPVFLVQGNHDGERFDRYDGTPNCMPVWSAQTRRKYYPPVAPNGFYMGSTTEVRHAGRPENYYAFDWGDAQVIALDPFWTSPRTRKGSPDGNWTRTLGKTQYQWLAKTLAGSKAKYKFVFIHHLVGGLDDSARGGSEAAALYEWGGKGKDGKDEFKSRRPGWEAPIHELLVRNKVAAVFHGHDHFYARQDLDGVAYIMAPQPGHPGSDRLRNAEEYGYIRGEFLPPSGHLRVTVSPEKSVVEYVKTYLPAAETPQRKNGEVASTLVIRR